ncbi:MAG: hypothetical protein ACREFX_13390, partial [Opitutaceae bacterium]
MQIHPSSSILRLACRLACCILPIAGGSAWTAAEASGAPGPDAAVAPAIQILFGTVGQTESTEASGERKAQSTAESSNFAAFLNEAGTTGTLIGYIASIGQGFAVNIALVDNNFVAITNALGPGNVQGQTLTLDGSLSDGTLSGTIEELNLPFSASVESATGTTASISGLYEAEVPGGNGIFSIVGTQGDIFVLAMTPTDV